jgi:multiple sugar transport system ATP-binding protein
VSEVRFKGVKKSFDDVQVLQEIDLEVSSGEFLVLVGPSGCGKSTLLRCIAGLESPSAGEIHIGGRRIDELEPRDRDVAMVFQSYALYPHMTVRENMGFALKLRKKSSAEIRTAVDAAADILGLGNLMDRYPKALSGGQRQRVAMGRAVVRRPKVFLFDEPLSNLDASLRTKLRIELKRLHRELGATMIYVTHDQVEAMTLADRIAVLDGGVLQQVDTPTTVYGDPTNRFVAGFIGSPPMCFLEHQEPGVVLGVRPHDVSLGVGTIEAIVDVVEPMGHENFVHLQLGNDRLVASVESPPSVGTKLMVDLGSPLQFDPVSGHRIRGV